MFMVCPFHKLFKRISQLCNSFCSIAYILIESEPLSSLSRLHSTPLGRLKLARNLIASQLAK
uniref:Uncharacterized protein n=1 Tax=Rhizophora mucronata TaxID=61149 RepID=A0A2P2IQE6_RHIMU